MENNVKNDNKGNNEEIEKTNKIKEHFKRNKTRYIVAGTAIVATGVGILIGYMLKKRPWISTGDYSPVISGGSGITFTQTLMPRGDAGTAIVDLTTGIPYESISFAAKSTGIQRRSIQRNLQGLSQTAGGHNFKTIGRYT